VLGDTDHESSYNLARRHRVDGSYDSGGTMISRKYAISSAGSDTDSDGRISKGYKEAVKNVACELRDLV
jgi:hypothetical protein